MVQKCRRGAPRCAVVPVPVAPAAHPDRVAATLPSSYSSKNTASSPAGFVKRRSFRDLHPCTRSGAGPRPTPCARSSTSGAGAPSSAARSHCRCQHSSCRQLESDTSRRTTNLRALGVKRLLLLLLNGYILLKEQLLLEGLTLAKKKKRRFSNVKCVFVFHVQQTLSLFL